MICHKTQANFQTSIWHIDGTDTTTTGQSGPGNNKG